MKIDMSFIPDAVSGNWSISTFEVAKRELSQMICLYKTGRAVPEGIYKRLMRNNEVIMSNTPDEINDFMHFVRIAEGSVLINGLGLGCVLKAILDKPEVTRIIVIENSQDVIKLVAPYFNDSRLFILHEDAFNYKIPKGERFDYVWHDIWDYICTDNLKYISALHRKYARKTEWQDSWSKPQCIREKRRENKYSY